MNHLKARLSAFVLTGVFIAAYSTPALASTTIQGNGAFSTSSTTMTNSNTTQVEQHNTAVVNNAVTTTANSGNNDASYGTGGSQSIQTGNANTAVQITNALNSNAAVVGGTAGAQMGDTHISDNGAFSQNSTTGTNTNATSLFQGNTAEVNNAVNTTSNTGGNGASYNTGSGMGGGSSIMTGGATTNVVLQTAANKNWAVVAPMTTDTMSEVMGNGVGSVDGNGAYSNNSITTTNTNSTQAVQGNSADVSNAVQVASTTGANAAGYNTGDGVSSIHTGSANTAVGVGTSANANYAAIGGSDAAMGGAVGLSGNGANSTNSFTGTNLNGVSLFQGGEGSGNQLAVDNAVNVGGATGGNGATYNTSDMGGGSMVMTGGSATQTVVTSQGNQNVYSNGLSLPGGVTLGFGFNLGNIFGF